MEKVSKTGEIISPLDALPAELGFVESIELGQIKQQILEAYASGDVGAQIPKLLVLYQAAGQAEVENIDGSNNELFTKGQISFIVARANMYLAASQFDLCRAELEDAYSYAFNMGYDDVADKIQLALENIHHTEDEQDADFSAEVAQALAGVLPEEVCAEISEADIDDVIGYACAELIKIGIDDPEAYLIEKGILE